MMCILTMREAGSDIPESHCSECGMRFNLCWNVNPVYNRPEYCPFCGDEIEEIIYEGEVV